MGEAAIRVGRYDLTFAKADKRALGNFAEGLIHFGRIDPGEANIDLVDHDRVAINDPAPSFEDLLLAAGGRQVRRARWRMGHRVIGRTERDDFRLRRWRGVALLSSGWREEFLEKTEHISCQGNKVGTNCLKARSSLCARPVVVGVRLVKMDTGLAIPVMFHKGSLTINLATLGRRSAQAMRGSEGDAKGRCRTRGLEF